MAGLAAIAILFAMPGNAQAQSIDDSLQQARVRAQLSISFPLSLIVPAGIRAGYALRDYIASSEFGNFNSVNAPEESFDEIYFTAREFTHGDVNSSLLASSFGVFEHEFIPVDLFGTELNVPLTSETHERFMLRKSHLPRFLYHIAEDDRDKPQHFFASGWLKQVFGMDWLVNLFGELVEFGEGAFVIGSVADPRDIHANQDGINFSSKATGSLQIGPSKSLTPNPLPSATPQ